MTFRTNQTDEADRPEPIDQAQVRAALRALDAVRDAYMTLDSRFRVVYANAEAVRLNRKPLEEYLGRTHWEEWPASVGSQMEDIYRRVQKDRVAEHFEHHYFVPGEYDLWIEISVYPDELGGGLHLVYRDITERVQREQRERFLGELALRARALSSTGALVADAVLSVGEFLGVSRCTYGDIDLAADTCSIYPDYCADASVRSIAGVILWSAFGPFVSNELALGHPVVVEDVEIDEDCVPVENRFAYENIGVRSHITVPIVHSDRLVSFLSVQCADPRKWTSDEVRLLQAVAEQTWLRIEVIRKQEKLESESEQRREQGEYLHRLLESSPDCIKTLDLDGNILSMTDHGKEVLEIDDFDAAVCGQSWLSLLQDDAAKAAVRSAIQIAAEGGTGHFQAFCPTMKGTPKWWDVVVVPLLGADGKPDQLLSISRDISDQRKAEQRERERAERERSRLNDLFQNAPAFMALLLGPNHVFEMANSHYLESVGFRDIIGKPVAEALPEVVEQSFLAILDQVYETGEPFSATDVRALLERQVPGVLEEIIIDATYQPLRDESGQVYGVLAHGVDVTERKKLEQEREALLTQSRAQAKRESILSDASRVLNASLDYEATLIAVAELIVPRFADWCAVDIMDEAGVPQRVAVAHIDPEKAAWGWELNRRYPTRMEDERGIAAVLRTGEPSFTPHITDDMLTSAIHDPERLRLMLEIGFTSVMIVPLAVRENVFGAISMIATRESGRIFSEDDLRFTQEIGQRAALAAQNARLFRETQQRAERESLLNRIGAAMRSTLDPEEILRATVANLGEGLRADRCYFARYNQARNIARASPEWIRAEANIQPISERNLTMSTFSVNRDDNFRTGATQVIGDIRELPPLDADPLLAVDIRALLRVPIEVGDQMTALAVSMAYEPREWTENEVRLVENVASLLHTALEAALIQQRERNIATQLQEALFPAAPPEVPGLKLAHFYRPALEESSLGGDFFDVVPIGEGCTALVVADLSGKGLAAASQCAVVRNMLRFALYNTDSVADAVKVLNRTLVENDLLVGFATLFVGLFDHAEYTVTYVNCGQEAGLIWRSATGVIDELDPTGPVLGGFMAEDFSQAKVQLMPGDCFAFFTDGLTEVGPHRKDLLGADGIKRLFSRCCEEAGVSVVPTSLVDSLIAGVDEFGRGGRGDDIALLVGKVSQTASATEANPHN